MECTFQHAYPKQYFFWYFRQCDFKKLTFKSRSLKSESRSTHFGLRQGKTNTADLNVVRYYLSIQLLNKLISYYRSAKKYLRKHQPHLIPITNLNKYILELFFLDLIKFLKIIIILNKKILNEKKNYKRCLKLFLNFFFKRKYIKISKNQD